MPMVLFGHRFPDVAPNETRVLHILEDRGGLPKGEYAFLEFYCDEEGCDCRRVVISVVSNADPTKFLATINYGWESEAFYRKWCGSPRLAEGMAGAALDPLQRQSKYAPQLLELFESVVLPSPGYIDRIKRHYAMFKGFRTSAVRDTWRKSADERARRPRPDRRKKRPDRS